jgi:hypothetical protein
MQPVGAIARRYCTGELYDDADVALTNGPSELGFPPLTEAMVDVEATVAELLARGLVTPSGALAITTTARKIFFADRTIEAIFERLDGAGASSLQELYLANRVSQKTRDALELVAFLKALNPSDAPAPRDWRFVNSPFWAGRVTPRSSSVTPL